MSSFILYLFLVNNFLFKSESYHFPLTFLLFVLQVDQSVNLLDSLNAVSRCDAITFLLQTLKCKYPEACDRVVRNLFSHNPNDNGTGSKLPDEAQLAKGEQLQLLLTAKKEKTEPEPVAKIKRESEDEAAAIDLNQNFEKILCKEDYMCLDQEDDFLDDDADDTENSSSMNKRLHFHRTNSATNACASNNVDAITGVSPLLISNDPLDLIPTAAVTSGLVKRKYAATFDEDAEEDDEDGGDDYDNGSNRSSNCEELLMRRQQKLIGSTSLVKRKRSNNSHIGSLVEVMAPVTTRSRLGEGYVFHEDNKYTLRYHHSSGEFSERAFKAQFRVLLRLALSQHHKPFLKQFYDNFVITGRLLGTTPSTRVLKELREQRLDEWRRQRERRQQLAKAAVASAAAAAAAAERLLGEEQEHEQEQVQELEQEQAQSQQLDQQLEVPLQLESQEQHQLRSISFGDSELESETESQLSSAAQEIMKFEEFIDEGVGAGRLIDGLEMEPEIDEMLAGAGSGLGSVAGTGSGNSNSNSSVVHDNGIASLLMDSSHGTQLHSHHL